MIAVPMGSYLDTRQGAPLRRLVLAAHPGQRDPVPGQDLRGVRQLRARGAGGARPRIRRGDLPERDRPRRRGERHEPLPRPGRPARSRRTSPRESSRASRATRSSRSPASGGDRHRSSSAPWIGPSCTSPTRCSCAAPAAQIAPVTRIDGRLVGDGRAGPIDARSPGRLRAASCAGPLPAAARLDRAGLRARGRSPAVSRDGRRPQHAASKHDALEYHEAGRAGEDRGRADQALRHAARPRRSPTRPESPSRAARSPRTPPTSSATPPRGTSSRSSRNGTAVLGLGNIGALAGKPVMEGKGVLFKRFADIDVFDLELDTKDPETR